MYAAFARVDQSPEASDGLPMAYFFYGTLCDPDVLRLVLGYRPGPRQLSPAILAGFRRKTARGRGYPVLVPAPAGRIAGLVFRPARPGDHRRLADYEGPEYVARLLPVRPIAAPAAAGLPRVRVFLAARGPQGGSRLPPGSEDWLPARWRRRDKTRFIASLMTQGPVPCAHP